MKLEGPAGILRRSEKKDSAAVRSFQDVRAPCYTYPVDCVSVRLLETIALPRIGVGPDGRDDRHKALMY